MYNISFYSPSARRKRTIFHGPLHLIGTNKLYYMVGKLSTAACYVYILVCKDPVIFSIPHSAKLISEIMSDFASDAVSERTAHDRRKVH